MDRTARGPAPASHGTASRVALRRWSPPRAARSPRNACRQRPAAGPDRGSAPSPARDRHGPLDGRRGIAPDDEIVAVRLAPDPGADRVQQSLAARAAPQRRAKIGGIGLAEAEIHAAGAGHAYAVAAVAEIAGQRRDEADRAAFVRLDVRSRAAGPADN